MEKGRLQNHEVLQQPHVFYRVIRGSVTDDRVGEMPRSGEFRRQVHHLFQGPVEVILKQLMPDRQKFAGFEFGRPFA